MNDKLLKKAIGLTLAGLIFLAALIIGYVKSDNVFYNNLLKSQHLSSPLQVFNWAIKNYNVPKSQGVQPYVSPRYLIENHKWLWCDEGAIVMATLNHNLGFKTRLIDLYGHDNISHHTILEVFEKDKWVTYDFTNRIYDKPFKLSSDGCNFKLKEARVKPYPKLYNALVNNNVFFKYTAFKIRGIKEY